jgi:uncharacterized protein (TIGR02588 family)
MTNRTRPTISAAEWVTLSLSVLIVGSLIVVALVEESRREEAGVADLGMSFDVERTVVRGGNYYVPYTVRNQGSAAITSAEIWVDIYFENVLIDSAEITVQFLPLQGSQDGVFVTPYDPATHTVLGRLESVQFP